MGSPIEPMVFVAMAKISNNGDVSHDLYHHNCMGSGFNRGNGFKSIEISIAWTLIH